MTSKQTSDKELKGLYAITDQHLIAEQDFSKNVELALQGGTRIIQYRDKSDDTGKRINQAKALCLLCKEYNAISIINDDIELAKRVDADGVHLGKNDNAIAIARNVLGKQAIIGISCYNDLNLAIKAEKNNASYVAFGAMFASPTKPEADNASLETISLAKQQLSIPVCSIGGITTENIQQLITCGTDMAAVISSLFATVNIKETANELSKHFN